MNIFRPILTFLKSGGQFPFMQNIVMGMWGASFALWLFPPILIFAGLYPQTISGLLGIVISPLFHAGISHLLFNTVSFFILGGAVSHEVGYRFPKLFFYAYFLNGVLLWFLGRPTFHIGLSGVVFSLLGFLITNAVLSRRGSIGGLVLVIAVFVADILKYGLPSASLQSWEGHLIGLFVGVFLAVVFRKRG